MVVAGVTVPVPVPEAAACVPGVRVCGPKAAVLPGGDGADGVRCPRGNEVDSHLGQRRTVNFGELHLQQNFLRTDRSEGQYVHDFRRVGAGQFSGALGDVFCGNVSGENDGGARGRNGDLLVGKYAAFFVGAGADVHIDAKVEAARALQFIPDEQ